MPKKQRRVGDAKVKPVAIALLGIISAVPRLVAVEDAGERGPAFVKVDKNARAHGRERRRRAAAQEVEGSDGGPSHRGVGQDGVFGVEEFGVRGKLPKFQRHGLGAPLFFNIGFVETRRGQRFNATDDQIVLEIIP